MDFIKRQFIDIITWTEDAADGTETMAWRFATRVINTLGNRAVHSHHAFRGAL